VPVVPRQVIGKISLFNDQKPSFIAFMLVSFFGEGIKPYRVFICILILLFSYGESSAQRYLLGRGQQHYTLNGYFEPGFRLSVTNSGEVRTSTYILTERIRANLRGYLLDSRVLTFNLGSNLIYNDTWISVRSVTNKSSSKYIAPYNFSCTILPVGRHPLSLFSSFDRSLTLPVPRQNRIPTSG